MQFLSGYSHLVNCSLDMGDEGLIEELLGNRGRGLCRTMVKMEKVKVLMGSTC